MRSFVLIRNRNVESVIKKILCGGYGYEFGGDSKMSETATLYIKNDIMGKEIKGKGVPIVIPIDSVPRIERYLKDANRELRIDNYIKEVFICDKEDGSRCTDAWFSGLIFGDGKLHVRMVSSGNKKLHIKLFSSKVDRNYHGRDIYELYDTCPIHLTEGEYQDACRRMRVMMGTEMESTFLCSSPE